ncbi:proteoglycan 4-like isoform X6 [Xenopus laevis]|uniref:Proteoglycan 4-like isoform X6 n=1 Tax=Xenopus laevis TaxID=8355 RepID=A0A8J1MXN4_XENLA|nr:proteoglycan 4-like isoform X6 [Xenopus laevis]
MERIYYITQVAVGLLICFSVVSAQGEGSCVGRCGEGYFRGHSCHCDYNCMSYMECCRDFKAVCTTENSCRGRCHEGFIRGQACDCDPNCLNYGKCCPDYDSICAKPIQRRSPAPRPPEERGNLPDKEQDTEKEQDKVPQDTDQRNGDLPRKVPKKPTKNKIGDKIDGSDQQPKEPDQDSTTPPPNVITPQPVKEKKQPPKKPKIPKKKPKKLVETEEDIEETEENETSSMFSTTRTKGTTIKRTRKDPKKKKPKDKKLNPKANATEPIKESFTPSLPPPPDNNENALMTPQTPRVGDDIEDPNGSKEDSTDNPPSSTTPKTAKKRSPPKTNKKEINKNQEKDELTKQSNKKKPSPEDIKGKEKTNPKGEKKDPSKGPDTSEKKQIKKPVSRGPRKRIIKNFLEDDTEEPSKIVNKKKPPPKDINRKKKVDSKEERQEIVESEFTNSSQSSSSRRRSKSTTRRMSENNKDVKNKNNKKIPDVKPLIPPKRKKDKDFLRTPEPTPRDEGSGDDGSGMVFLQTTPSTTSLPTSLPKETFYSTETPKPLSTDEHSLKTTPVMNIFTDLSSASTDKTKEPFKQTENPAQPTEDSTSKATANDENNVRTSIALTSRPVNETSTDPSQNVGSISKQPQITTSSDTVTSFYRNIDKTTLVHTNNPLTDEERAGNQKGNTGDSRITVENSTIIKWTPYTTQSMTTEEMDKNTPLFEEANKDGLLIYPTVSSQNMENFTLLPTEIKIQQTTASTEGSINDGLTTTHSESKNSSFSAETVFTDMSTTILTTLRMSPSMSHPETSKISRGISTTDSTVTRVTDNVSGFVLPSEPDGNNPPMVSKEYTDRTTTVVLTSVSNSIGQSSDNNLSGHTEQLYTAYALNITSTEITQSGQSSPTNEVPKTAVQEPTQVPADSSALVTVETSPDHLVGSSLPTVDAPQSLSPAQENSTRQSHSSTMNRGLNGELASTVAKQPSEIHTGDIVTPGYIDYIHSKLPTQSSSSSSNLDITEQTASTTEHSSHTYKSTTVKENESRPAVTQTPQKDHSEIAVSATDTRTEVIYSTHSTQSTEQSTLTKEAPLSTALNKDIDKGYTNLLDTKGSEAPTEASTMITQQLNTNNIFSPTVTVNLGHKTSINEATSEQAIVNTPETKQSITDMPKTVPNERNTEGMVSVKTPNSAFVEPTQWQHTDQSSKAPQPVELNEERIHSSTGDTIEDHAVSVEDIGSAASHSTSSANAVTSDTNTLGAIILSTLSSDKTTQTEMQKASITRTTQLPIDLVGSSLPTVDAPQSLSPAQENSTRQSQSSTITMYRGLNGELASTVAKQPSEIHTGDTVTPVNAVTTLQEQSTPDNKTNDNSHTTSSEGLQTSTSSMLNSSTSIGQTNEPSSSIVRNMYDTPNQTSTVEYSTLKLSEKKNVSSGHSTVFFTTQTIVSVPTSNAVESKENSTSPEGTYGYSSPTPGQKTEDLPTSKPQLTSSDVNISGNRTFADIKETTTTSSTTQPMESVSTTTQVNVASLQSTVKSSEKEDNTTKEVTTKPLLTEQQTNNPSVSSGHSTVFFTTQTIVSVPTSNAVESKENSSSTEGTHGYSSLTPGQKTEDLPTSKPQLTSSDNTSGNRTFVDIKKTTTTSSTTQPMKSVSTTTQENVASLQSTVKSSEKEDNTTKEVTTKPLLTEQQTNNPSISSGHSTVFFTTQTIVSVPTSNAVESKENSSSTEGTHGYSSPTPGQKTEDLPTSKPQLTSSDVNTSGNRTFVDIKETTTTSSTTQPIKSVSTTTQVNVASLQSTVKSSEKEDNTTKEVTTKPLLTEQQTNNPSVSSGHSTVFFTTQTIVSVPTSNAVESKENSSSTEGTHGYSSPTPGQKTEDLPTSKPQLTSSDNTSGNRTFVDIKETTTTSSTTQPMKSVSTTTQVNVASLQSTVKSSEKEDNTTKEGTTKPLLTEQQTNNPSVSSGHSTVFFTTQTIVSVPTSNAVESKENSSSTEGTHGYSSPTPGQKTEDLPTSKPQLTSSDVNTSGNRTFVDIKETTTTSSDTQPMKSVSTTTQVNVASLQSTVKSSEKQDNTTKGVTNKPLIREQQTKNPSVSSFPKSTVKYDVEKRPTVPKSDNRNTSSSRVISVEQMENKYNANPPHSLDHFSICEMLLDKENKLGISESDLQLIRKICMEIHSNFTSVSTPSSETKLPSQNPSDSPPKHFTTQSRVDQPNEKLLPNKTIIQIVEEISRKHLLFPSHKTNKSAAWILLLKKIRSPQDPQMNLCNGQPVNGMTTLQNGSMVVFRGHYFWTLNQGGAVRQARKISDVWGIPSPVDTVFTRCNCAGKTFFIKGPQYWRFTNDVMDKGYPKEISTGFGGLKGKVTAVLSVAGFKTRPESVYFFKGGGNVQKYTFRQEQSKRCTKKRQPTVQYPIYSHNIQTVKYRYPRDIQKQQRNIQRTVITIKQEPLGILHQEISVRSTWRGIPNSIVSAISLPNSHKPDGFDYFVFSKEKYYNINITSKVAVKPPPNSEQKISKDWYKCKE